MWSKRLFLLEVGQKRMKCNFKSIYFFIFAKAYFADKIQSHFLSFKFLDISFLSLFCLNGASSSFSRKSTSLFKFRGLHTFYISIQLWRKSQNKNCRWLNEIWVEFRYEKAIFKTWIFHWNFRSFWD